MGWMATENNFEQLSEWKWNLHTFLLATSVTASPSPSPRWLQDWPSNQGSWGIKRLQNRWAPIGILRRSMGSSWSSIHYICCQCKCNYYHRNNSLKKEHHFYSLSCSTHTQSKSAFAKNKPTIKWRPVCRNVKRAAAKRCARTQHCDSVCICLIAGIYTKYKPFLQRDKMFLRMMAQDKASPPQLAEHRPLHHLYLSL